MSLKREGSWHRHRTLLPELFDGLIINAFMALTMDNAGELMLPEPIIEAFEAAISWRTMSGICLPGWGVHAPPGWGRVPACPAAESGG